MNIQRNIDVNMVNEVVVPFDNYSVRTLMTSVAANYLKDDHDIQTCQLWHGNPGDMDYVDKQVESIYLGTKQDEFGGFHIFGSRDHHTKNWLLLQIGGRYYAKHASDRCTCALRAPSQIAAKLSVIESMLQ